MLIGVPWPNPMPDRGQGQPVAGGKLQRTITSSECIWFRNSRDIVIDIALVISTINNTHGNLQKYKLGVTQKAKNKFCYKADNNLS